jgi:hypothetical protein
MTGSSVLRSQRGEVAAGRQAVGVLVAEDPLLSLEHRPILSLSLLQPTLKLQYVRQRVAGSQGLGVLVAEDPPTPVQHRPVPGLGGVELSPVSAYTLICRLAYGLTCRSAGASCSVGSS